MKFNFIDLYCGAGGLSKGFELAGFELLLGVDIFHEAIETHKENHEEKNSLETDITSLSGEDLIKHSGIKESELDVLIGGPPCQGFSMAGKRDCNDQRNNLVWHFIRMVDETRPKFVVMENVKGILSMKTPEGESVIEQILERFDKVGYTVNYKLLNAADYGVPQKRERVFFLASRDGINVNFPEPTHTELKQSTLTGLKKNYVTVRDALMDLPEPSKDEPQNYENPPESEYQTFIRNGCEKLHNHLPTRHKEEMIEKMRNQLPGKSLYKNWAHSWVRLKLDEPSPTVKENHNAPFVHPTSPRVGTPRECARLQSFPDSFIFKGTKSAQLVQIGNAVPPLLSRAVALSIKKQLEVN